MAIRWASTFSVGQSSAAPALLRMDDDVRLRGVIIPRICCPENCPLYEFVIEALCRGLGRSAWTRHGITHKQSDLTKFKIYLE
jgi:hypothetical protein